MRRPLDSAQIHTLFKHFPIAPLSLLQMKAFVPMLDLDCEPIIVDLFHTFFGVIKWAPSPPLLPEE